MFLNSKAQLYRKQIKTYSRKAIYVHKITVNINQLIYNYMYIRIWYMNLHVYKCNSKCTKTSQIYVYK